VGFPTDAAIQNAKFEMQNANTTLTRDAEVNVAAIFTLMLRAG
jgi:hypothetical protein